MFIKFLINPLLFIYLPITPLFSLGEPLSIAQGFALVCNMRKLKIAVHLILIIDFPITYFIISYSFYFIIIS